MAYPKDHDKNDDESTRLEKYKFLLEEIRLAYQLTWTNKQNLEDKAIKITGISSILSAIIFGFGSIIFTTSIRPDIINTAQSSFYLVIFSIIIVSMISALISVAMALLAIKIMEYFFIIGRKDTRETDVIIPQIEQIINKYFKDKSYSRTMEDFRQDYIAYIIKNFKLNEKKAIYIRSSFYLMLASIGLITITLILLFTKSANIIQ